MAFALVELLYRLEGVLYYVLEGEKGLLGPILRYLEYLLLCLVDEVVGVLHALVAGGRDIGSRADDPPYYRLALHYPGIVHDVGGCRRGVDELDDIRNAAYRGELVCALEEVRERDRVYRGAPLEELYHAPEELGVGAMVEVLGGEQLYYLCYGVLLKEDAAKDGLLRLKVVRRDLVSDLSCDLDSHWEDRGASPVPSGTGEALGVKGG